MIQQVGTSGVHKSATWQVYIEEATQISLICGKQGQGAMCKQGMKSINAATIGRQMQLQIGKMEK